MANKLFVGNLAFRTTEPDLQEFLNGKRIAFESVKIPTDKETGRSRGVGFITLGDDVDSDAVIHLLHDAPLHGRNIRVEQARSEVGKWRGHSGDHGRGGKERGR